MKSKVRLVSSTILTAAIVAVLQVFTATPALAAGTASSASNSVTSFGVDCDLGNGYNVNYWVYAGGRSPCADTDAIYLRPGTCGQVGARGVLFRAGWKKISDWEGYLIRIHYC